MEDMESYEVTSIIGSGTFGTCYKVKHKTSSEEYVWKAVNYGQMTEEKKQLLVSEVNLLSKLRHPNIVRYYDHIIHQKSSTLYIIMEWCSGGDLSKIIKLCTDSSQFLEELFIWRVLFQLALALNVCHSQCTSIVLHRDIKPANVFLDSDNNVKLGDFGLAKILEEKENFAETVVGTPLYMSPELIRNNKYNKKSDVWALGCLIYEICTLKPPFLGNNFHNLSAKIKEGKYARIPTHYSDDLQKMINFMLSVESENRPTVDIILRHPTVLSKSNKTFKSIYKTVQTNSESDHSDLICKMNENLQNRIENIRNRELAIKIKEEKLAEKERALNIREKKIVLMERLANDKMIRANLYLKRSKENKSIFSTKYLSKPPSLPHKRNTYEDLDTSLSADPGDTSILPTSTKIHEEDIIKPRNFVRSKSERRVHFNARKVFEKTSDDVVFKEYNFFTDNSTDFNQDLNVKDKIKKKSNFGMGVLKALNNRISQSSTSLGSKSSEKSSSNGSEKMSAISSASTLDKINPRPVSWSEENKKCAFTLLKMINAENNKENIHSKICHTKM